MELSPSAFVTCDIEEMDLTLYMFVVSSAKMSIGIIPKMTNASSSETVLEVKHTLRAVLLVPKLGLASLPRPYYIRHYSC